MNIFTGSKYTSWEYTNFYIRYVYGLLIIIGILLIIYRIVSTDDMAFGKLSDLTRPLETVILTVVFMIIDIGIL